MEKHKNIIELASVRNMIFAGILLLLLGIILDQINNPFSSLAGIQILQLLKTIVVQFFIGIGTAIIISALFSWIIGTESFIEFIDDKILKKISSPEYVKNLSPLAKKQLLKEVMKPSVEVSEIYSATSNYFESQIAKSLSLFKMPFRSDLHLRCKSSINPTTKKVETISDVTYKTYKFEGKHVDFQLGLESENVNLGDAIIYLPDGYTEKIDFKIVDSDSPEASERFKNDDTIKKVAICTLPERVQEFDSFLFKRIIIEEGKDHWQHYVYRSTMPIHGLNLTIDCEEGLIIKDAIPYSDRGLFEISISNDKRRIEVICAGWIEPGFGLSIIIASENH